MEARFNNNHYVSRCDPIVKLWSEKLSRIQVMFCEIAGFNICIV